MPEKNTLNKVSVFAASGFATPLIELLMSEKKLAGVILPDPNELAHGAGDIHGLAAQLQQASVPFQLCCQEKLPLIVRQLDLWQAQLGIIASYPHILPTELVNFFPLGLFNLHTSMLPAYKGPAPIYWQIRNRETETAIVLHRVETVADSGNIVACRKLPIHPLDTLQSLSNQLAFLARELILELFEHIQQLGTVPVGTEQQAPSFNALDLPGKQYARRPVHVDGMIDFDHMSAHDISALCRAGANQFFAASLRIKGAPVNLLQASVVDYPNYGTKPGTVIFVGDPEGLIVGLNDGALRLDILASADGIFDGIAFAERFNIDAGMQLQASNSKVPHTLQ